MRRRDSAGNRPPASSGAPGTLGLDARKPRTAVALAGVFGAIPGVPVGSSFASRREAADAGVHRPLQGGISGGSQTGAESIVVSGGYEDDEDHGDTIIYTGHGGNDPQSGRQVADQTLTRQNLALAVSSDRGLPVRVVRGAGGDPQYSPASGYRYDGLYFVESYWKEKGRSAFDIWRFRLVASPETNPVTNPPPARAPAQRGAPTSSTEQSYATVQRLVRNTAVTEWVKELYDFTCQVCGTRLETPAGPYAEGAHVRPMGRPHNGPDSVSNVLCLCPNHHVLFDRGVLGISEKHEVLDRHSGERIAELTVLDGHELDPAQLRYHWSLFRQAGS
jgi:putative restriction endonuclease